MQHVKTLIPTDFWFRTGLIIVILVILFIWLAYYHSDAFEDSETLRIWGIFAICFIAVSAFDLYLRRGYQISFDDEAIYWRKAGIRRYSSSKIVMPLSEINEVLSEPGTLGSKPFEAVVLRSAGCDIDDIVLSRMYLRDMDIKGILTNVASQGAALFDDEVRKFYHIESG